MTIDERIGALITAAQKDGEHIRTLALHRRVGTRMTKRKGANATMPTSTTKRAATATIARTKPRRSNKKDSPPERLPVAQTNLTPEERALLADPNFVTEDEADVIISERRDRRGGRMISLQEARKRLRYKCTGRLGIAATKS